MNWKKINSFLGITFGLNFSLILVFKLVGGNLSGYLGMAVAVLYMFIPALSVVITQKLIFKEKESLKDTFEIFFKPNIWFLVALLLPIIISILAFGISLLFPGILFTPDMAGMFARYADVLSPEEIQLMKDQATLLPIHPFWLAVIQSIIAGLTINAVAAFGEELGWRGFLLKEFKKFNFWTSSLLIGFIWGVWHSPLIIQGHNYPQHPQLGVLMMVVWCMLLSPIFSYVRLKAKSVISAAILHGTLNGAYGLSIMFIMGGNDLTVGVTGLAGFFALILVNVGLIAYDRWLTADHLL